MKTKSIMDRKCQSLTGRKIAKNIVWTEARKEGIYAVVLYCWHIVGRYARSGIFLFNVVDLVAEFYGYLSRTFCDDLEMLVRFFLGRLEILASHWHGLCL